MFVFRKIWWALFCCNTAFETRPFALLPTRLVYDEPLSTYQELLKSDKSKTRENHKQLSFQPIEGQCCQNIETSQLI